MDAKVYAKMLADKNQFDLKKMQFKYSVKLVEEFIENMKAISLKPLPLKDFEGNSIVWNEAICNINLNSIKFLASSISASTYGLNAMEDEIHSTLAIENIKSSRDSIRKVLNGFASTNDEENKIMGIKKGIDYVVDSSNPITAENISKLYSLMVSDGLDNQNKLLPGNLYRHDKVFIIGNKFLSGGNMEHEGLPHKKIDKYMKNLVEFINQESEMNDLFKGAVIHFYIGYLHPYFDGNGRMARMIHLWFLLRKGFPGSVYVSLSDLIEKNKKGYYEAFTKIEENSKISKLIDISPFIKYFALEVYNKISQAKDTMNINQKYSEIFSKGEFTSKERDLWEFVMSAYGDREFSTKQIEKDFGNAAYATIRAFVLKFEQYELLTSQKYKNRVKYKIK